MVFAYTMLDETPCKDGLGYSDSIIKLQQLNINRYYHVLWETVYLIYLSYFSPSKQHATQHIGQQTNERQMISYVDMLMTDSLTDGLCGCERVCGNGGGETLSIWMRVLS